MRKSNMDKKYLRSLETTVFIFYCFPLNDTDTQERIKNLIPSPSGLANRQYEQL